MIIVLLYLQTLTWKDWTGAYLEKYIQDKKIEYRLWWNWPVYYDCWWVVTEAYRKLWYTGYKFNSKLYWMKCQQSIYKSKKGDVLIDTNEWKNHVALITSTEWNKIKVLDYVNTFLKSSYRYYWIYPGLVSLDKDCLLNK